jgi:hypothetical protein
MWLNKSLMCVLCETVDDLQVDHETKPFSMLRDEYLAVAGAEVDIADWQAYHRANADFQMLCVI